MPDASLSPHAVFLSYAHEDAGAARRIADALRGFGVEVWFDQSELRGGDAWDQKIRRQIKDCALFVPVISEHTEARGEGYFRLEWRLADERTHLMAKGVPFLLPVVVDATADGEAMVPDSFRAVQWTRLPDGAPTPEFVAQVKRLLDAPRKSAVGKSAAAAPIFSTALAAAKPRFPVGIMAALGVVVLGLVAFILLRPATHETAAGATKPAVEAKTATPALPADKSIAVLPFDNLSEDKEANAFFADGIHETILTNLAHLRELRVVSRTSVMEFRGRPENLRAIAQKLNVAYILEGSVQRSGKKVRVTGQLIRAATDEHLWADDYTKDLTAADIFDIESELAQKIAASLQAVLSPQEQTLLAQRPTENLEAYDLYLKARAERRNTDPTASSSSIRQKMENFLQAAVTLDPGFAEAWGELAVIHADAHFFRDDYTEARLAKAQAAMDTAVRLAPDAPDVIHCLGDFYFHAHRDYARATEQYEKLLLRQPNDPGTYSALAYVQRRQGRWAEALANLRKASQLDPGEFNSASNVATTLEAGRRYDDLALQRRRLVEMRPGILQESSRLALNSFKATGATREMEAFLANLKPEVADTPEGIALRRQWAALQGNLAEAIRFDRLSTPDGIDAVVARLANHEDAAHERAALEAATAGLRSRLETDPTDYATWGRLARNAAVLGHAEEAVRCARKAVELLPESLDTFSGPALSASLAFVYAWTGDKDRAIAEYARLLRTPRGAPSVYEMKRHPDYFPMRGDPRFEALLNDPKNNTPLF